MILEIQHETSLRYPHPVTDWLAELRVEPVSDADQTCQSFSLKLREPALVSTYIDGFGNTVHHFNYRRANDEVTALAAAIVETHPRDKDWSRSRAAIPDLESLPLFGFDFLALRGPVKATGQLEPLLDELRPGAGTRAIDVVQRVARYIPKHFEYAKDVTNASSPIGDLLRTRKGVCQDFAHLMIAILRSFGIPARYVSGYIHRPGEASQSHAWCEAWVPDLDWVGIDPTNNMTVGSGHVKVAVGRDFTDVPPNKGLYHGESEESIFVRVETRELDRLPSRTWQEQLPPLHSPPILVSRAIVRTDSRQQVQSQQQQ